jgi:integrase
MPRPKKLPPPEPKRHERRRGEGTVREVRPGVYRAWRARVHHADGTSGRPSRTFSGPQAEARAALWAAGGAEPQLLLLGAWLDRWLALRRPTLDPSTYALYRTAVQACAPLAARPLAQITADEWQALTNALLTRWSRKTVAVWRGNITTALRAAIPTHLDANPLAGVKLPRAEDRPPKAWTQAEVDRLLAAAAGHHHEPWLLFCLGTGVRLGESRALLWADVDLVARTATIRASLDNTTAERGPTKTRRIRTVDLPDELVPVLAEHRKRQPVGQQLVFGHGRESYRGSTYRVWLRRLCARASVAPLSPHATRHTFVSLALDAGVPIQDISRALGHATIATTQTVYAHFLGDGLRRAAKALGAALRHRYSGPKRRSARGLARASGSDQE